MATTFEGIYNALRGKFKTDIEVAESTAVHYDNGPPFGSDQSPYGVQDPSSDVWVALSMLTGASEVAEMGASKTYRTIGVLRASIFGPLNRGDNAVVEMADKVNIAFRGVATTDFCPTDAPSLSPGRRDGQWWRIDVSYPFFADVIV